VYVDGKPRVEAPNVVQRAGEAATHDVLVDHLVAMERICRPLDQDDLHTLSYAGLRGICPSCPKKAESAVRFPSES
jgi:hypothetical protein